MTMPRKGSKYQEIIDHQIVSAIPTSPNASLQLIPPPPLPIISFETAFASANHVDAQPTDIIVPTTSYFDMRGDKEKRAYIMSFCDILGRVKTNHHFRCKGCGETFVAQYMNMLVHMAGPTSKLNAVRTRICKKPIEVIKNKILQDFANYQPLMRVKSEPGTGE
jgi:hypothetical protein